MMHFLHCAITPYRHTVKYGLTYWRPTQDIRSRNKTISVVANLCRCWPRVNFAPFRLLSASYSHLDMGATASCVLGYEKGANSRPRRTLLMTKLLLPRVFSRVASSYSNPALDCANLLYFSICLGELIITSIFTRDRVDHKWTTTSKPENYAVTFTDIEVTKWHRDPNSTFSWFF